MLNMYRNFSIAIHRPMLSPIVIKWHPLPLRRGFKHRLRDLCLGWLAAMVLLVAFVGPLLAQTATPLAPPDRTSPRDWVASFYSEADRLEAIYFAYRAERTFANASAVARQMAVLRSFFDLGSYPPAFRNKVGGESATALIDILNRLPQDEILSGPADSLDAKSLPDHWTIPGTEIVLSRQIIGLNAGMYLVQPEVIDRLQDFHARIIDAPLLRGTSFANLRLEHIQTTGPLVPQAVVDSLPMVLKRPILGTPIWKQIVAASLFFFVLWLNVLWWRFVKRTLERLPEVLAGLLRLSGPILFATSFVAYHLFIENQLNVQGSVALGTLALRNLSLIATGAWLVWTVAMIFSELLISSERLPNERLDAHLTRLIGKIFGTVGAIATFIFGLSTIGIPAAGLITSLGVGGIGIALAARVTIENLIGGLNLLIDRPFRVGDWVAIGEDSGRLTDIGARSCRFKKVDGTQVVIPNSVLSAQPIVNLGPGPKHRLKHVLSLPDGMSREDVEIRLASVRAVIAANPMFNSPTPDTSAKLINASDGTLKIDINVRVNTDSARDFDTIRTETLLALLLPASGPGVAIKIDG